MTYFEKFDYAINWTGNLLANHGHEVPHARWQGLNMQDRGPEWNHWEVLNVDFEVVMSQTQEAAVFDISPNMPWAENHFKERVGGIPTNPGIEYKNWPHWRPESEATLEEGRFSHTYQERFWPKKAGDSPTFDRPDFADHRGIRFKYGDLADVIKLLLDDPYTRQAYLPVWFPEDTGAVHRGRVPCTLGYHFMIRENILHLWYEIRSCDYIRHFRDDLYLAVRLAQWVRVRLEDWAYDRGPEVYEIPWDELVLGMLTFHCHSMHVFMGDRERGLIRG